MAPKISFHSFVSVLLAVFLIPQVSCKKDDNPSTTRKTLIQSKLQEVVDSELAAYQEKVPGYPGGICMNIITKDGSFFVSSGYNSPVTDGIHFRAASNTKTLTSTAILLLYQQDKLNINHKITDTIPGTHDTYVPNTPEYNIPFKNSITILDLLRHRAGVFDIANETIPDTVTANLPYKNFNYIGYIQETQPTHTFTFDELVNVVAKTRLYYFLPGTAYHYSNTGYSILGKIIERVSGKSYQRFLMEDIIKPSQMMNSSMPVSGDDRNLPEPFLPGFVLYENQNYDVTQSNMSANVAEGNLITTPDDLSRFLRNLISGKGLLNPHIVNNIMMSYLPTGNINSGGYGCGLTYTNKLGYGHTGAHEGYLSLMASDPDSDFTIVIFTNAWNLNGGMTSLIDQVLGLLENTSYKTKSIVTSNQ